MPAAAKKPRTISDPTAVGITAHGVRAIKTDAMLKFAVEERKRFPTEKYITIQRAIEQRFRCSPNTAQRVMREADELLREEFNRWVPNAPRMLLDAYWDLHLESLKAGDRSTARGCLDSIRDMFGLKSAVQVVVTPGAPAGAYAELDAIQLEALARLDLPSGDAPIIDAASVEASVELADVAVDEILDGEDGDAE